VQVDLPRDAAARQEALERWAAEQSGESVPRNGRLRTRIADRLPGADLLLPPLLRADQAVQRFADRLLDRGLNTSAQVALPENQLGDRVGYGASGWHVLPRALRYVGVSDRDTFVDFGCGKGRVVHQAAQHPFRRVIGVEVSPELADVARDVLAARRDQHRCRDVEIVVADATRYRVPDDVTIAYFDRPFGDETLRVVLQNIVDSIDHNPRRVRLIYLWALHSRSTILATGRFRLVKEQSNSLLIPRALTPRTDRVVIFESV
jgi:SAM-dependent methyltransferase